MAEVPGQRERTVAELEAQRAAEQEALRKVRRLTDELEEAQRSKQRLKKSLLRTAVLLLAAFGLPYLGYWIYGLATAQERMESTCAAIKPGMSFDALKEFANRHGLLTPARQNGIMYLAETRSFGRHACKVTLENGVVSRSEHNYAD